MRAFAIPLSCILILASALSHSLFAQNIPLTREKNILFDKYLNSAECRIHTSIQPLLNTPELQTIGDSIMKSFGKVTEKRKSKGEIAVNGIFASEGELEKSTSMTKDFLLEGGVSVSAVYKNKLAGNFTFLSGNSSFNSYFDTVIKHSSIVPEIGSAYASKQGYSYQYFSGYLSYSPNKIFNLQAGKDKNFWGDGYRSLFLSDVSNSYPFLKISTTVWKIKYVNLFTMMKDVTASPFRNDFKNKYGTFHYLSWNATKRINVALFESIIWQGTDSNRVRSFDVSYLNPIIFFRPIEYSLGSSDNAFLGASFKIKVGKKQHQEFYGQLILDEFVLKEVLAIFKKLAHPFDPAIKYGWWGNKQGVQLGFKSFDLFTLKNMTFQTEINAVRPYTYSHGSVQQNYGNYNQSLAHPLGANFTESVSFLNYRYKRWTAETEFLYAIYGKDKDGINYGGNIFESYTTRPKELEYGNKFWQGLKTNLFCTRFKIGYYIVPSADLIAEAGLAQRKETNSLEHLSSAFFFIGIKTGLMNRYNDF